MNIFMTGATGYIGSEVASTLLDAGHEVTALARPDSDTKWLRQKGVTILSGDLSSLPARLDVLDEYGAFIHTAISKGENAVANDKSAIDAFLAVGKGQFIFTSGVWVLGDTGSGSADESSPVNPLKLVAWRPAHEELVLSANSDSFRTTVLRPGCVYGGRQSMLADWFAAVEQGQPIRIVGPGTNRWALIDLHELAQAYLSIIESGASGLFHATDDSENTLNEMALTLSRSVKTDTSLEHSPVEQVRQRLGGFADALAVNQRVLSNKTRQSTGWSPRVTFSGSIAEQWHVWKAMQSAASS